MRHDTMSKRREACGRCGLSSVVDASNDGDSDPFGDERIEVSEEDARRISPSAWIAGVVERLDDAAMGLTYRR